MSAAAGRAWLAVLAVNLAALLACHALGAAAGSAPARAPYALVLGTAQDGGLPQVGCELECCAVAWRDPARRRLVASLLLADPRSGRRWLFDATPDLREQVQRSRGHPPGRPQEGPRPALFDGIFLTHGHMGHYTGLLHLGREAYGAKGLPVFASPSLCELLATQAPWKLLVEEGRILLRPLEPGRPVRLAPDLSVTPLAVPHRHELTDTLAFVLRGPDRALLYLPDIDKWERWERPLEQVLAGVDVALIDGTFHADGELPGRSMARIPHPFMVETLQRLAPLPAGERAKVLFTHLNHSNPAADPGSGAARELRQAGLDVASEGQRIGL